MTENYQLIWSEDELRKFYDLFFADYTGDQVAVIIMMSRRKYDASADNEIGFMNRYLLYPNNSPADSDGKEDGVFKGADRFIHQLRLLEVKQGTLVSKRGHPVSQKSLVVYTTLNPKSALRGWMRTNELLMEALIKDIYSGDGLSHDNARFIRKLESRRITETTKCVSEKRYLDLDVDSKEYPYLDYVMYVIRDVMGFIPEIGAKTGFKETAIIETRGGYHVVLDKHKMSKPMNRILWESIQAKSFEYAGKTWPNTYVEDNVDGKPVTKTWISVIADTQVPTPGTIQGGYNVHIKDFTDMQKK